MRRSILACVVAVGLIAAIEHGRAEVATQNARTKIDFVQNGIGVPPAEFEFWRTGRGSPGDWAVVRDTTASGGAAIEQSSRDATENRYPLAIYKPQERRDQREHKADLRGRADGWYRRSADECRQLLRGRRQRARRANRLVPFQRWAAGADCGDGSRCCPESLANASC